MASGPSRKAWLKLADYERFERVALVCVLVLLSVVTVAVIVLVAIDLIEDLLLGPEFLDKAALQDTFGRILTIVILLEFNHSIFVALTQKSGAIQVRIIVLITVLVVARKLMLLDYAAVNLDILLGFGALLLSLGALYWLISLADRKAPLPSRAAESDPTPPEQ
jgi:uncharacterized membrane protein (DUF373 family)